MLWELAGGSTLVVGSLIGCFARLPARLTAAVMASPRARPSFQVAAAIPPKVGLIHE
jgi:hypothetical protein